MARRIAVNGLFLDYAYSGTWTYTRNLIRELPLLDQDTEYTVITRRAHYLGPEVANLAMDQRAGPCGSHPSNRAWIERLNKLCWEQVTLPIASRHATLLHSLYFAAPWRAPASTVVTVHDAIPLTVGYGAAWHARAYANLMRLAVRRARAVITVSDYAKETIAPLLSYPRERIHVVPEAPDPSLCRVTDTSELGRVSERYRLPDEYVLYVGGVERRKNIRTLVQAWSALGPRDTKLVLVGRFVAAGHPLYDDIPGLIRDLRLESSVHLIDSVQPDDLAAIYSRAQAFCYPSLQEGFGLPPLEAMACGTPVLASNATSLPEVLRDGAQLIEPLDIEAWSRALDGALSDEVWRQEMIQRGTRVADSYTWADTARQTLAVYDSVLGGS